LMAGNPFFWQWNTHLQRNVIPILNNGTSILNGLIIVLELKCLEVLHFEQMRATQKKSVQGPHFS
jgi:hypothetical protein